MAILCRDIGAWYSFQLFDFYFSKKKKKRFTFKLLFINSLIKAGVLAHHTSHTLKKKSGYMQCMNAKVRTSAEFIKNKNCSRGTADAYIRYAEIKQCAYGLSDGFKIDQTQLKARSSGQSQVPGTWYFITWPFRAYIGTMSIWRITGLLSRDCIERNIFWPQDTPVDLILAKTPQIYILIYKILCCDNYSWRFHAGT